MKDDNVLIVIAILMIAAFYYFAQKKPSLSVQLMDNSGNLAVKGSAQNPVTSDDILAVQTLLIDLINRKAAQPN